MKIKKQETQNSVLEKEDLDFKIIKNCLEATQIENKINHLEKNKIQADCLKEHQKEFVKNNNLILKTQQRFKSERHNVFTEEIDKIDLSSNDDKKNAVN